MNLEFGFIMFVKVKLFPIILFRQNYRTINYRYIRMIKANLIDLISERMISVALITRIYYRKHHNTFIVYFTCMLKVTRTWHTVAPQCSSGLGDAPGAIV